MRVPALKRTFCLLFGAILPAVASWPQLPSVLGADSTGTKPPNVVFILTDNHGAWTLGCYGNKDIRTPHIDKMAAEGLLMERAFASNPVCSPTRATFLTGLIPSQHGVHCFLRGGNLQIGPDARNTLADFPSVPEVLKKSGYRCGLVGKWHLGDNLRPQEGLDDYWVTMPHGGTSTFYGAQIIEDGQLREEPTYLTDFWTQHAVRFIEQSQSDERPFFLYLAYNGPYALGRLLLRDGQNRHVDYYSDKELPSFPREPTHPWQFNNRDYINNPTSIRRVAAEVSGIDDGVGTVLKTLQKMGLDENTLVVFAADQGWVGGQNGFFGMGDHTRPLTAVDGMMQIPMIWRHPGKIPAERRSDLMVSNYDFLPTLVSYLGLDKAYSQLKQATPSSPTSPGRDFSALLKGHEVGRWDNAVFYEFEDTRAVRTEGWKFVRRLPNGPNELYDLQADPLETHNLFDRPDHAEVQSRLNRQLEQFFDKHASPKYDMWHGGGSQVFVFHGIDEPLPKLPPKSPPPLPEDFEPAEIQVPEGFTVELAAGPPLVQHPMMACFDDRGRLFVADSAGKNLRNNELEEQLPNRIRMLEDTDRDGHFDTSTIFADKMTLPMGGVWHEGALFVAAPPNIWRLEDTDGDGIADKRDNLVDGFGYNGNAAGIHGCFLGPEGRIYWTDGRHGHEIRSPDGGLLSKGAGSYIFSCKSDGSDLRAHCGGGMDNPVEIDFTDEGEMLGTVNILYRSPRVDCLVHWLHGGVYPHSERVLGEFRRTGPLLGPVYGFGHVAVSGMTRYRSGLLDRSFRDDIFVSVFNTGKVVRLDLQRSGATFEASQHEFLSSSSEHFHPTDVLEDADGSLLVVDTGGWFRIGCPTSQIARPEFRGAIYRIRRPGSPTFVDPAGLRIDWAKLSDRDVERSLADTRHVVRQNAIAELARRGEAGVAAIHSGLRARDGRERQLAVWALARIGSPSAAKALRELLADPLPYVRQSACFALAELRDRQAVDQLTILLSDDHPPLRREAAKALGRIGDPAAVPSLLAALERDLDRTEEHTIIFALIELGQADSLQASLISDDPGVRRGAMIALDQLPGDRLSRQMLLAEFHKNATANLSSLVEIVLQHGWSDAAGEIMDQLLADSEPTDAEISAVTSLMGAFASTDDVAVRLGQRLNDPNTPATTVQLILKGIQSAGSVKLHPSWQAAVERGLRSSDTAEAQQFLTTAAVFQGDHFRPLFASLAADASQPVVLRLTALQSLSRRDRRLDEATFAFLMSLLREGVSSNERIQAAQVMGAAALTPTQLAALLSAIPTAGPFELPELIRPFATKLTADVAEGFSTAVRSSDAFFSLRPLAISEVIKSWTAELLPIGNAILAALRQHEEQQLRRLAQVQLLTESGDQENGRKLFHSEKIKCATCHRIADKGGKIGPDLSRIGRIRMDRDLLEAVLFPSASFVREYEPYTIVTDSGRTYSGTLARETADVVYLQQQTGDPVPIPRNEIEIFKPATVSIMPQGLDKILTDQELADIVAYLKTLK